jgi:hypothetical protein
LIWLEPISYLLPRALIVLFERLMRLESISYLL